MSNALVERKAGPGFEQGQIVDALQKLIELTQLKAARIDRACDVTDIIDNVIGAGIGALIGLALLPLVRPWRLR